MVLVVVVVVVVVAAAAAAAVAGEGEGEGEEEELLFQLCNVVMLPEQLNPSPKYPPIQVQVKFPGVLVQ